MILVAAINGWHWFFMITLSLLSIFMVLLILVQRGRGGGLTGALGGMGGQSAFGTKAGDLFTRITIIVAAIWVLLSMASLKVLNQYSSTANLGSERGKSTVESKTGEGGLLPSATKTGDETPAGDSPLDKATEATTPTTSEAAPAATPPTSATAPPAAASDPPGGAKSTEPEKP